VSRDSRALECSDALPSVWSKCQRLLTRCLIGPGLIAASAALFREPPNAEGNRQPDHDLDRGANRLDPVSVSAGNQLAIGVDQILGVRTSAGSAR
jgi:hypothetical protein